MMFTYEDVKRIYDAKCRKYHPEELDEDMKKLLYEEAVKEVRIMNTVNKGNAVI